MIAIDDNNLFKSFFAEARKIPLWVFPIVLAVLFLVPAFIDSPEVILSILGGVILLPFLWACFYFPKLWIYMIALSGIAFLKTSSEGVSAVDVAIGALFVGGFFYWFYYVVFVLKDKIVRNLADWLILFFFIAAFGNVLIGIANGVDILDAVKEHLLFMITLLYFPMRYYINSRKDIVILLSLTAFMVLTIDLFQFYGYYKLATENLTYAYQLGRTIRSNQTLFTAGSIFGITFYFFTSKMKYRLLLALFSSITVGALISSFSRTFWVVLILQIIILFFFLSYKKKIELSILSIGISGFIFLLALLFMKENTLLLIGTVSARFMSTGKGTQDISVQARFHEYKEALKLIEAYPLGGNGFYKSYIYFDPLTSNTISTTTNHNAYIYLAYRFGIPMMFVYLAFLLIYFFKSIWLSFVVKDDFYRSLAIASFLCLLLVFIASSAAAIIAYRDGMYVVMFSVFGVSIADEYFKSQHNIPSDVQSS